MNNLNWQISRHVLCVFDDAKVDGCDVSRVGRVDWTSKTMVAVDQAGRLSVWTKVGASG